MMSELNMKRWRESNGRLIHDGDCHFWSRKICTCGLLHHLLPRDSAETERVYPGFGQDYAALDWRMDVIERVNRMATTPPPLPDEEVRKILAEQGWVMTPPTPTAAPTP